MSCDHYLHTSQRSLWQHDWSIMKSLISLVIVLCIVGGESNLGNDRGRDGNIVKLRQRRKRKKNTLQRSYDNVVELIPNIDLYIGPEQGAEAREKYRDDVLKGGRITYNAITHAVNNKQPLLVGKMGNTEYNQVNRWFNAGKGSRQYNIDENVCRHSGVCPLTIGMVNKFATKYIDAVQELDVHFRWHVSMREENSVDKILFKGYQIIVNNLLSLDPWFFTKPYSSSFAGKTVLVVSAHADYILRQYNRNRTCIFKGRQDILPEFTLKTVKSPLPPAPNDTTLLYKETSYVWPTWEETLQSIKLKVLQQGDFDIMLIAAGSFSLPVAAAAKQNGKVAIVLGGTMNVFFGLYSHRYDSMLHYRNLIYTDCFLRMPMPAAGAHMENSAYW